jgi:signal peptidase I
MEENNVTPAALPQVQTPETQATLPPQPPKKSGWKSLWEFIRFAAIVIAIVVGIRLFIAQPFIVSGTSMVPTFQDANYLIVDEISYHFHAPERGDVIVFHPPFDMSTYYIKRVIGLPGETVTIENGTITIKNAEHPDGFVLNEPYITPDTPGDSSSTTVPEGQYFVMGDNRPASYDSRRWGMLPAQNISGRALIRLFPLSEISLFPGEHVSY